MYRFYNVPILVVILCINRYRYRYKYKNRYRQKQYHLFEEILKQLFYVKLAARQYDAACIFIQGEIKTANLRRSRQHGGMVLHINERQQHTTVPIW